MLSMLNTLKKCRQILSLRTGLVSALDQQLSQAKNHVFLFLGEEGIGKKSLASLFASAFLLDCSSFSAFCEKTEAYFSQMQVEEKEGKSVSLTAEEKKHFHLLAQNVHPDLLLVEKKEGESSLKIEEVRQKIEGESVLAPQLSKKKVWILCVDDISEQAQNTLLKTLEETKEYAYFFLLSSSKSKVLPTLLSRSQIYTLPLLDDAAWASFFSEEKELFENLTSEEQKLLPFLANGNIGRVKKILEQEDFFEKRKQLLEFLFDVERLPLHEVLEKGYLLLSDYKKEEAFLSKILFSFFWDMALCVEQKNFSEKAIFLSFLQNKDFATRFLEESSNFLLSVQEWKQLQEKTENILLGLRDHSNFELAMHYLLLILKFTLRKKKA